MKFAQEGVVTWILSAFIKFDSKGSDSPFTEL